jgi:hypothetical protein
MHCEGKLKLRSHNTSYCLIEMVCKAGLTVNKGQFQFLNSMNNAYNLYLYKGHILRFLYVFDG